jgi:glutathione peroxidase
MWFARSGGKRGYRMNNTTKTPPGESFYGLQAILNNGTVLDFNELKGKKVLIVNTASDCGFTNQYEALQELHAKFSDKMAVIGFPSNDFKEQEKGTDEQIADFCRANFGVTFPLAKKTNVTGAGQNEVFRWLSDKTKNGWNDQPPTWNFSKYLVSENGVLLHYFDPGISPMSADIVDIINDTKNGDRTDELCPAL